MKTGDCILVVFASAVLACLPYVAAIGQMIEEQAAQPAERSTLRAGAAAVDISPSKLPVTASGMWVGYEAEKVNDPLHASCLVLDDGKTTVALVVVDSLMLPRELLDEAKEAARKATGIPTEHILISATHTHAAPAAVGVLGSDVDEQYASQLPGWLVESIVRAFNSRMPAKAGWAVANDFEHTHCRQWIYRSDRLVTDRPDRFATDPFGGRTIRANMIPGYQDADCVGPTGPADPGLSLLAVQSLDGRPIAVLANYSMHFFEWKPISADYFGKFSSQLAGMIGGDNHTSPPVVMLSQGTAGDQHWMDFSQPAKTPTIETFTAEVAKVAYDTYKTIEYHDDVPLAMAERRLRLGRRVPDENRLAWAREIVAGLNGRSPQTQQEIYAHEQIYLHEQPERELQLQAVRIGELGITATPCEAFAITGLKLKAQSPLRPTFNIGLANGAEGYIPPPELYPLGGYTTWPARSAGLEVTAEPKIAEAVLQLLEEVSGLPRNPLVLPGGPYVDAVLASKPLAYWRMCDIQGPQAADASGHGNHGDYEDGVVHYLEGPPIPMITPESHAPRAAHFAGGRMKASLAVLGNTYSVELWFWNGMPHDARPVTGTLFSRNSDVPANTAGDCLGIDGTEGAAGRLVFVAKVGDRSQKLEGKTIIPLKTWCHVIAVREGAKVAVYLNGIAEPEIADQLEIACPAGAARLFVGGCNSNSANFEGKIAEVSLYNRALTPAEITNTVRNPIVTSN